MDSQERHELQQNDLEEFFTHFGEFWSRWGNTILTTLLIVILVVTAWRFWTTSQANAFQEAWYDLAIAADQPAAAYQQVAESHSIPAVKALAYLRGGDAALGEALGTRMPMTEAGAEDTAPADPQAMVELAGQLYQQALDVSPAKLYRINALLGLGAVAEFHRDWNAAKLRYEQVLEAAGPGYETLRERAQIRLDLLDDLSQPVVFAPDAQPAATQPEMPASQDATEPTSTEMTAPAAEPATTEPASTEPATPAPAGEPAE